MRMSEVAERAGVSAATVSRVLADSPAVRPEYRERVLRTVELLGYRPNRLASNLRRLRTEMIGIVVSDVENPHFTQMVRKVEDAAYRRGWRVLLCNADEDGNKQRSYLEVLAAERVSGVILSTTNPAGQEIAELSDSGVPLVALDRTVGAAGADAGVSENVGGAGRGRGPRGGAGQGRVGFGGGPPDT